MQLLRASKSFQIALQASKQLDECYLAAFMQRFPFFLPHITAAGIFYNVVQPCGNGFLRDLPLADIKLTYKVLMCSGWPCMLNNMQAHVFSLLTASHAAVRAVMFLHAASMLMSLPMISSFSRSASNPMLSTSSFCTLSEPCIASRLLWILLHRWCFLLMLARTRTGHIGICA